MNFTFATYFDLNYAAVGIAMMESLLRYCPGARIHVLCLDESLVPVIRREFDDRVSTMLMSALETHSPHLAAVLAQRDAWERYAMVKPFQLDCLLATMGEGEKIAFIDADTFFYSDPRPLFDEVAASSVAISPHRFNDVTKHLSIYGTYNAGFGIWRNDDAGRHSLRDWQDQCCEWCHNRTEPDGRFMDQGYLNAWPTRHEGVAVFEHPGQNLAPWNVGSHQLELSASGVAVDGRPLVFFHFSGVLRAKDGRWQTFYTFKAMKQPAVLEGIYRPYLDAVEAVSVRLLEGHGIIGRGTVREHNPDMPMLALPCSVPPTPSMMVWIPSFPRCGNKLARIILTTLFKARTFTVYPQIGEPDKVPVTPDWKGPLPAFTTPPTAFADVFFMKTHELPETDHPAIYIVRDGRDAYVSFAHFVMQHFPEHVQGMSFLQVLKMLIRSKDHFAGWSQNVQAWTQRKGKTAVIRFEQMVVDPAGSMAAACAWIGIPAPKATGHMPGFGELKANEPQQFRKGKSGGWREEMPPAVEELFWSIHGETMTMLGYPR